MDKFLDKLYQTYEQEIRGSNKPIEDVDRRPNYIGMCINMFQTNEQKIQCLRQVKEQTAMNPFYQHRIDRFIDAITNTWEPTDKPGFVEYIRGERDSALVESLQIPDYLDFLEQDAGPPPKVVQLKASGAEQDDEEPPTDERTKKFEKDEAKVGTEQIRQDLNDVLSEDPLTIGTLLATTPMQKAAIGAAAAGGAYLMGKKVKQDLQKRCHVKHEGYPERIKRCLATGH
jgi:hypothetical protein